MLCSILLVFLLRGWRSMLPRIFLCCSQSGFTVSLVETFKFLPPQPAVAVCPVNPKPNQLKTEPTPTLRQNCLQIFPEILNFSQYFNLQILTIDQASSIAFPEGSKASSPSFFLETLPTRWSSFLPTFTILPQDKSAADAIDIFITADCESTQDFIDESEDEANIGKKCVTWFNFNSCDEDLHSSLSLVDRLKPLYVYTIVLYVYAITTTAMYKYAYYAYCCYVCYDAYLAKAALGSDISTLGLLQLAVITATISQQNKTAYYRKYAEEGKDEQKEKEKKLHYLACLVL